MARSQSPGLLFGKWILVPILLALLGYFVIGPRLGRAQSKPVRQDSAPPASSTASEISLPGQTASVAAPPKSPTPIPAPDLDISVHKLKPSVSHVADTDPEAKPKRHHKKGADPDDLPKVNDPSENQPDEGGSAGSTSAG